MIKKTKKNKNILSIFLPLSHCVSGRRRVRGRIRRK